MVASANSGRNFLVGMLHPGFIIGDIWSLLCGKMGSVGAKFVEKGGHSELILKSVRGHLNLNLSKEGSYRAEIFRFISSFQQYIFEQLVFNG